VGYYGKPIKSIRKTFEWLRDRAGLPRDISLCTIRHTMADELRKRGVPLAEVAGLLGHSIGYHTTERYAKYGPEHAAETVRAIDAYFADLNRQSGLPQIEAGTVHASRVLPGPVLSIADANKTLKKVVEQRGIEPLTSTLRTSRSPN
jgi:hypothetical protein